MIYTAAVLLCTAGCDLFGPEDTDDTEVTSSLELKNFSYSGGNDVYFTLYGSEGPGSGTAPVHSQKVSGGISGEDIVFDDLNIEEHEDEGEQVQLYIASDDGNGTLDTGTDYIMPILRFDLYYGEYRQIPFLDFDTGGQLQAGLKGDNNWRVHIQYGQLAAVNESAPLILRIDEANGDFTDLVDRFKQIPIADKGFINQIELQCQFTAATDYFLLLFHDLNNDGLPDADEPASSNSSIAAIPFDHQFNSDDHDSDITVSEETPLLP
jgi:hypothetical protein